MDVQHFKLFWMPLVLGVLLFTQPSRSCTTTATTSATDVVSSLTTTTTTSSVRYVQCYNFATDGSTFGRCQLYDGTCTTSGTSIKALAEPVSGDNTCGNFANTATSFDQCQFSTTIVCRPAGAGCASGETTNDHYTSLADCQGCTKFSSTTGVSSAIYTSVVTLRTWTSINFIFNGTVRGSSSTTAPFYFGTTATVNSRFTSSYVAGGASATTGGSYSIVVPGGQYYAGVNPNSGFSDFTICMYKTSISTPSCTGTILANKVCAVTATSTSSQVTVTFTTSGSGALYSSLTTFNPDSGSATARSSSPFSISSGFVSPAVLYLYYTSTTSTDSITYTAVTVS